MMPPLARLALAHERANDRAWHRSWMRSAGYYRPRHTEVKLAHHLKRDEIEQRQKRGTRIWWPRSEGVGRAIGLFTREPVAMAEGSFTLKRPRNLILVPFGRHRPDVDIPF